MKLYQRFLNLSISHKTSIILLLFNFIIFIFILLFVINRERYVLMELIENDLSTKANMIGNHSIAALLFDDKKRAFELLSTLSSSSHFMSAAIYDSKNNLFVQTGDNKGINEKPLEHGLYERDSYLTVFRDIVLDGNRIGKVSITIELRELDKIVKRNAIYSGFMTLLFFASTLIMVEIVRRFLIMPITMLRDEMKRVSKDGNYSIPSDKEYYNDEIGDLYRSFEEMLIELDKKHREQERFIREKERIVQDLHDGLGGIATNISLLANLSLNRTIADESRNALMLIKSLAEEALLEIRGFMHSLQDVDSDWYLIAADMKRYGESFFEPHGILFQMDFQIKDDNVSPPGLRSINIFRIYKEALNNIVKHSKASKVVIDLKVDSSLMSLYIKDNGIGFKNIASKRMGLLNMKARAEEVGGRLTISSDEGVAIHLEAPTNDPNL